MEHGGDSRGGERQAVGAMPATASAALSLRRTPPYAADDGCVALQLGPVVSTLIWSSVTLGPLLACAAPQAPAHRTCPHEPMAATRSALMPHGFCRASPGVGGPSQPLHSPSAAETILARGKGW